MHTESAATVLRRYFFVIRLGANLFASALVCILTCNIAFAENWSRFRGPNGAGQSDDNTIPTTWQPANTLWRQPITGVGHSSPVIWNDKLFLTSADATTGTFLVLAFDTQSGAPLWQKQFVPSSYHINDLNSFASSTPAVDAQHAYVLWLDDGKVRLVALNHSGEEIWQQEVGTFEERHGFGVSPIVVDGLVYVANDSEAQSSISAFDCQTGQPRWKLPRASGTTAFATPCLLDEESEPKLLLTASTASGLSAIDARIGKVVWNGFTDDLTQRCVSSPIVAGGLVFVGCGQGGNGQHLLAIRPGNSSEPPQEAYRLKQSVSQVTTPVVAGDLLFVWSDRGIVSCYDVATGKQHWRERIGGDYHGSPIRIGDRILNVSRNGDVVVLAADRNFKVLARNSVAEPCIATPAVANHRLFLRTEAALYCIGQPTSD